MTIIHYINGGFVYANESYLHALDLGLMRGYGVFDYVQSYKGQLFHLEDHLERLQWSAEQIDLELPKSLDEIFTITQTLVAKNERIDAGVRLILTGGMTQDLMLPCNQPNLIILFHPYVSHPNWFYTKGLSVITSTMLRFLPSVKTTNYIPAVLAMKKAKQSGFDDAIYMNHRQELLEATTSNAFFIKDGVLVTCDSDEIVKGITRKIILNLVKDRYSIEYRSLSISEIETCDEAFLCSSIKDVVPLVMVNDKKIGSGIPGPETTKIRSLYRTYLENYIKQLA